MFYKVAEGSRGTPSPFNSSFNPLKYSSIFLDPLNDFSKIPLRKIFCLIAENSSQKVGLSCRLAAERLLERLPNTAPKPSFLR